MERRIRNGFLGGAVSAVRRLVGSRFAKPAGQAALAVSGLLILAVVGRTAVAGGGATPAHADEPTQASAAPAAPLLGGMPVLPATLPTEPAAPQRAAPATPHVIATSEAPVVLNTAAEADLRRLPGIGAKRADAILALRARLGRFRAVEDLLKVRGIGRATLRRLRPLIRVDAAPTDAGLPQPSTPP